MIYIIHITYQCIMYYNVCGKFKSKLSLSRVYYSYNTIYMYVYTYSREHILITKTDKILIKLGRPQTYLFLITRTWSRLKKFKLM